MFRIISVIFVLFSVSAFAQSHNYFSGEDTSSMDYEVPREELCDHKIKSAIYKAKIKCYEANYRKCEVVDSYCSNLSAYAEVKGSEGRWSLAVFEVEDHSKDSSHQGRCNRREKIAKSKAMSECRHRGYSKCVEVQSACFHWETGHSTVVGTMDE